MSDHTHSQYVAGCYRCDLSRDEVTSGYITEEMVEEAAAAEWASEWPERDFSREPDDLRDTYTRSARAALGAVLPDIIQQAKAEAWDEGAEVAWGRSTPEVNGARYHWRSAGEPVNPYEQGGQP